MVLIPRIALLRKTHKKGKKRKGAPIRKNAKKSSKKLTKRNRARLKGGNFSYDAQDIFMNELEGAKLTDAIKQIKEPFSIEDEYMLPNNLSDSKKIKKVMKMLRSRVITGDELGAMYYTYISKNFENWATLCSSDGINDDLKKILKCPENDTNMREAYKLAVNPCAGDCGIFNQYKEEKFKDILNAINAFNSTSDSDQPADLEAIDADTAAPESESAGADTVGTDSETQTGADSNAPAAPGSIDTETQTTSKLQINPI